MKSTLLGGVAAALLLVASGAYAQQDDHHDNNGGPDKGSQMSAGDHAGDHKGKTPGGDEHGTMSGGHGAMGADHGKTKTTHTDTDKNTTHNDNMHDNNMRGDNHNGGGHNGGGRAHGTVDAKIRVTVNATHHFHAGAYRAPRGYAYRRYNVGERLDAAFYARDYWLADYATYDLIAPPDGYTWVRFGPDAILIDEDTGEVIQVQYGVFD